ncbi:putative disease resistance protein [Cocos nucifera]|uniref:Putative disease resistance protein n=1 Tax=Cocos nucifera TaxID=13894 RepID=A0A8K0MVA5_COCNU|nr:putative disease resistance protein [Cocos nucifera]
MDKLLDLVSSLKSITSLYIWDSKLKEDPMEALQSLSNLKLLSLYNAYDRKNLTCNAEGFQELRKLSVLSLAELEKWEIESGAMPGLRQLFAGYRPNLTEPPEGLRNMDSVLVVQVAEMPEAFVSKVRTYGIQKFNVQIISKHQRA